MSDTQTDQPPMLDTIPDSAGDIRQFVDVPFDGIGYFAVAGFLYATLKAPGVQPGPHEVALIRKNRPPWQAGKLNGIGGRVEIGESAMITMIREFGEETGITSLSESNWRPFAVLSGTQDDGSPWAVVFFTAETDELLEIFANHTDEYASWYPFTGITTRSDIIPNLKWLIPMSLDKDGVIAHVREPKKHD